MEKNINMDGDPQKEVYGYPPMWDSGYAKYWLKDLADKKNLIDYYYFKQVFAKEDLKHIHELSNMKLHYHKLSKNHDIKSNWNNQPS